MTIRRSHFAHLYIHVSCLFCVRYWLSCFSDTCGLSCLEREAKIRRARDLCEFAFLCAADWIDCWNAGLSFSDRADTGAPAAAFFRALAFLFDAVAVLDVRVEAARSQRHNRLRHAASCNKACLFDLTRPWNGFSAGASCAHSLCVRSVHSGSGDAEMERRQ